MVQEIFRAIGAIFRWWVVVAPWEQALRIRMGKRVDLLRAGIYLRIPFIDRVYRQPIRRRVSVIRPQTVTTSDGKAISLAGAIGFKVVDLKKLFDTLNDPQDTLEAEVSANIAEFVFARKIKDCAPIAIEAHVRDNLDIAKYGLGEAEFYLTSFASVKTYRFITGDMPNWNHGGGMDMECEEQVK